MRHARRYKALVGQFTVVVGTWHGAHLGSKIIFSLAFPQSITQIAAVPTFGAPGHASAVCLLYGLRSQGRDDPAPGWGGPDIGFLPFPQLVPPKALEPIGASAVYRIVLRILRCPRLSLERPGIDPVISQLKAASYGLGSWNESNSTHTIASSVLHVQM